MRTQDEIVMEWLLKMCGNVQTFWNDKSVQNFSHVTVYHCHKRPRNRRVLSTVELVKHRVCKILYEM